MEKRKLIILGGTLLAGIILIGGLMLFESTSINGPEITDAKTSSNAKDLEKKIADFRSSSFQPEMYATLLMEINSSKEVGSLQTSKATFLTDELNSAYKKQVFDKADYYLNQGNGDKNTVLTYLNSLEKVIGKDPKIDFYKAQIPKYDYYANVFPGKVTGFTNGAPANFSTGKYNALKSEAENMPGLDGQYKSKGKFSSIRNTAINQLNNYKSKFEAYDRQRKLDNIDVEF